jgi:hypothetical protein
MNTTMRSFRTRTFAMLLCTAFLFVLGGCKKEGCTERNALNYDSKAKKKGDCTFSSVVFRANTDGVIGVGAVGNTTIKLDGATIGTIAGNGSLSHPLHDGKTHNWRAEIPVNYMGIQTTFARTGTVTAISDQNTITVDVWD